MALISVIIPNYNCGKWLSKTLESCLKQKEFIKEIIVVDDFSTDNSMSILYEYASKNPELIKVFLNKEKGGNNARNYGYSLSSGEYIQWLDADDILLDNKLKMQLEYFGANPNIDIVYSDWEIITYDGSNAVLKSELKKSKQFDDYLYELLNDNWIAPHAYLVKKQTAQKLHDLNGWNPLTKYAQDREYFTIAAISGAKFGHVAGNNVVYNRYLNNKSLSRSVDMRVKSEQILNLLVLFLIKIKEQTWITLQQKIKYQNLIYSQAAYYCAVFKHPYPFGQLKFHQINWYIIKGMRTKIKVLYYFISAGFKYSAKNLTKERCL